jgi:hypothetical protein
LCRTVTRVAYTLASKERAARAQLYTALPMLSVFSTWAASHPGLLNPARHGQGSARRQLQPHNMSPALDSVAPPAMFADSGPSVAVPASSQDWESAHLASPTAERTEARARSALKAALSELAPYIEADLQRNQEAEQRHSDQQVPQEGSAYLREHIELRGFLPVAAHIEVSVLSGCLIQCHLLTCCCAPTEIVRPL